MIDSLFCLHTHLVSVSTASTFLIVLSSFPLSLLRFIESIFFYYFYLRVQAFVIVVVRKCRWSSWNLRLGISVVKQLSAECAFKIASRAHSFSYSLSFFFFLFAFLLVLLLLMLSISSAAKDWDKFRTIQRNVKIVFVSTFPKQILFFHSMNEKYHRKYFLTLNSSTLKNIKESESRDTGMQWGWRGLLLEQTFKIKGGVTVAKVKDAIREFKSDQDNEWTLPINRKATLCHLIEW